jgi:hypothetical protein
VLPPRRLRVGVQRPVRSRAIHSGFRTSHWGVGDITTRLSDTPTLRCGGCDGDRFIRLTFPNYGRTTRTELPPHPTAKCAICGLRYVGTQPRLVTNGATISLAERDDANTSAPWGRALAEWALLTERENHGRCAQPRILPIGEKQRSDRLGQSRAAAITVYARGTSAFPVDHDIAVENTGDL